MVFDRSETLRSNNLLGNTMLVRMQAIFEPLRFYDSLSQTGNAKNDVKSVSSTSLFTTEMYSIRFEQGNKTKCLETRSIITVWSGNI